MKFWCKYRPVFLEVLSDNVSFSFSLEGVALHKGRALNSCSRVQLSHNYDLN